MNISYKTSRTNPITVVDARMGRGKSSAAIRYMNRYRGAKKFLYITPYLTEVSRICESCDFEQPDSDHLTKSSMLKNYMRAGKNVAATHSLFYLMDEEALEIAKSQSYSIIIDESIEVMRKIFITSKDFELVRQLTEEGEDGTLRWVDSEYSGKLSGYKNIADVGSLYRLDSALFDILNPHLLEAFDEVFMLTYLFDGQYQKAYLDYFGFSYNVVGVEKDIDGYVFSDKPDCPPPVDYSQLINLDNRPRLNKLGRGRYALSKAWYTSRGRNHEDVKSLRNCLRNFFTSCDGDSSDRLWTCFKEDMPKLVSDNGRYRSSFLQLSARATNEYKNRTDVAYMINRFVDPNISKFFSMRDISVDQDKFALSEMLQWIWRSAIRDDKPINLYIPSKRMRDLLINWMNENSQGGQDIESNP